MRRVEGATLCRTTQCPREFVCLESHTRCPCTALGMASGGLALEKACTAGCPYATKCNGSDVCTCPTRAELHERYQL